MPCPPATFATARLTARPPHPDDAPAAFATYANDPEVTRYLTWKRHHDVESLAVFFGQCSANWEKKEGQLAWLLFLAGTSTLVGSIGVTFEPGGKAMFGYVLGKKFWHRGLTAEALTFLVDWSLTQPEVFRAWAYCDAANPASARVMEKAGLVREGLLRRWQICPAFGPDPRDCIVCAKVK